MSNDDPNTGQPNVDPPPAGGAYPPAPQGGYVPAPPPTYGSAPMPGGSSALGGSVARPPAMDTAVKLMRVGGVLSVVSLLSAFFVKGQIRDAVQKAAEDAAKTSGKPLDPATVDTLVNIGVGFAVFFGLIGALLWFWMASANGKGKPWARIVATIFFAISLVSFLLSFIQATATVSTVLSVVSVAIGAAAIFLMYKKESTAFYQASSAPRM